MSAKAFQLANEMTKTRQRIFTRILRRGKSSLYISEYCSSSDVKATTERHKVELHSKTKKSGWLFIVTRFNSTS